ncbi:MAG: flagellar biosynthesis anti-sigma factor FlgM [Parasphingorhabdus sp.]
MKPVENYSAINTRLDRPVPNEAAAKKAEAPVVSNPAKEIKATSTTVSLLAAEKPSFDEQKVSEIKQKIASGDYAVDTDALANKMLEVGVLGVETKK